MTAVGGAQAKITNGMTLFLDARNLTAERAVGDVGAVVRYAGQATFYPAERRAFYGGLRVRFYGMPVSKGAVLSS